MNTTTANNETDLTADPAALRPAVKCGACHHNYGPCNECYYHRTRGSHGYCNRGSGCDIYNDWEEKSCYEPR